MGNIISRQQQAQRPERQILGGQNSLRALSSFYGPNFVLDSNGVASESERAFLEDIANILASGITPNDMQQLNGLGDIYAGLPPAEIKSSLSIQSSLNLPRSSIKIVKHKPQAGSSENRKDSPYGLELSFDSLCPCYIRLYWGSKEKYETDEEGNIYYTYLLLIRYTEFSGSKSTPWVFGPFPAGMGQRFILPDEFKINNAVLRGAKMEWVSEMNLDGMAIKDNNDKTNGKRELLPIEKALADVISSKDSISNTASSKKAYLRNLGPSAIGIEPSKEILLQSETENATIETEYQSGGLIGNVTDKVDDIKIDTSSYHLIIELKEDPKHDSQKHELNTLATMIVFGPSSENRIDIKYSKQICLIKGDSYVLQEVYGFTELEDDPNS